MATKKRAVKTHVDNEWISDRIAGHGGGYSYNNPDGRVKLIFICGKPKIVIWLYNLQLLYRYIKRKKRRK